MTTGNDKYYAKDWDHDKNPVLKLEDGSFRCARPPVPWSCTREPGHEGPCAALRSETVGLRAIQADIKQHTDLQPAFYLSLEQKDAASKWMNDHDRERHIKPGRKFRYSGAIGGAYTWCFTPTSLGVVVTLECCCGEKLDVSDYDW